MNKAPQISERELVERCVRGESSAQRELYERYAGKMYAVCVRYVGRETAKDVLQEGFITVFDKLGTYRWEGSFEGWMRRIFVNGSLMELRKTDILRGSEELGAVPSFEMSSQTESILSQLGVKELMALVGEMPAPLRTVFNLSAIEGYSHEEISSLTGITVLSSRTQLCRARAWLQERILKLYGRK